ncbi:hypothetical protein [Streptomyces pini]|uniref:Uncharacterized protein n=1 Tax=Streptomyces pini TaxID=1520580 RepID=A0A1I4C1A2_9ACTN|nr:hypothetical protein [Streptomyces pini]SFK74119.1 hypothetical protein SAMN05192584_108197 [Streptomyces pini]
MTQGIPLAAPNTDLLHHQLILAAEDLTNHQPTRPFDDGARLALAHNLADNPAQERQLLAHMPRLDGRTVTRGEYALILADAAKGL